MSIGFIIFIAFQSKIRSIICFREIRMGKSAIKYQRV